MRDESIKGEKEITYNTEPKDGEMKTMKLRVMEDRLRNSNPRGVLSEKTGEIDHFLQMSICKRTVCLFLQRE